MTKFYNFSSTVIPNSVRKLTEFMSVVEERQPGPSGRPSRASKGR